MTVAFIVFIILSDTFQIFLQLLSIWKQIIKLLESIWNTLNIKSILSLKENIMFYLLFSSGCPSQHEFVAKPRSFPGVIFLLAQLNSIDFQGFFSLLSLSDGSPLYIIACGCRLPGHCYQSSLQGGLKSVPLVFVVSCSCLLVGFGKAGAGSIIHGDLPENNVRRNTGEDVRPTDK